MSWKSDLEKASGHVIDIESAISVFFPGDPEYTKTVVDTMEAVLLSGDALRWAELKRLDAHAAKHGRTAPDQLLNIASLVITKLCSVHGAVYCKQFRDMVYDRIESFHNQCREGDSVPQSVSRARAKHELLHSYNVKTYGYILTLVGTVLTRADEATATELGKRIVSNHNHWFNLGHVIEFLRSSLASQDMQLLTALAPGICLVISGICGTRLGSAIIDQTPLVLSQPVWTLVAELLDTRIPSLITASLSCMSSLDFSTQHRPVLTRVLTNVSDLLSMEDQYVMEELLSFLFCLLRFVPRSDTGDQTESAITQIIEAIVMRQKSNKVSLRLRAIVLKLFRILAYGTSRAVFVSILSLDSPIFRFLIDSVQIYPNEPVLGPIIVHAAVELVRTLLQRAPVGEATVPVVDLLVTPSSAQPAPLCALMTHALSLRRARKSCCYILHQCVIRSPVATRQVLSEHWTSVSQNIARVLLDTQWEEQMDLVASVVVPNAHVDIESLTLEETRNMDGNYSISTLTAMNAITEAYWQYKLETECEKIDKPISVPDRLEYWLVHDNPFILADPPVASIYHSVSARLLALLVLFESSESLCPDLLGLVSTSVGVMNNDLDQSLVAIDALFLLLDSVISRQDLSSVSLADMEYLYALKIVAQCVDQYTNQAAMLRFIQFRWQNRFAILHELLLVEELNSVLVDQLSQLLHVTGVELLVAYQLVDSDAEHVRNMRDFGAKFLLADVIRGHSRFVDMLLHAFTSLPVDKVIQRDFKFFIPPIVDPRLVVDRRSGNEEIVHWTVLTALVDSVVSVIVHWAAIANQDDKTQVVPFIIEAITDAHEGEFWDLCVYVHIVPKLYALVEGTNSLLAFNLRTLRTFVSKMSVCKNAVTKTGIVECICLALTPFVASAEIWMIENDRDLCAHVVDVLLGFVFDVLEHRTVSVDTVVLPLTVLGALLATRHSFTAIEIVKDMTLDRYRHQFEKILSQDTDARVPKQLVNNLIDIVEKEILFQELAI